MWTSSLSKCASSPRYNTLEVYPCASHELLVIVYSWPDLLRASGYLFDIQSALPVQRQHDLGRLERLGLSSSISLNRSKIISGLWASKMPDLTA